MTYNKTRMIFYSTRKAICCILFGNMIWFFVPCVFLRTLLSICSECLQLHDQYESVGVSGLCKGMTETDGAGGWLQTFCAMLFLQATGYSTNIPTGRV
jgi:hypothetical protein